MAYENVTLEKQGNVAVLTLNRPPANTISRGLLEDMDRALSEIENDKEARVVIITGAGEKGFSAGFDVIDAANAGKGGPTGQEVWLRVERFPKPVIAAINGYAFGGGCELAMSCHFRFMVSAEKAKIGLTELNLGIIPGWGGTQRLPRIVGKSKALDMIFLSKRLSAVEAFEIGLVDKVCAAGETLGDALVYAQKIAQRPPIAISCVLKAVHVGLEKGIDEGLKVELDGTKTVSQSKDAAEGITAFLERREPVFKGD